MPISDDNDTRAMLELHSGVNLIEICMEKNTVSHQTHEEFTRMLNLDNESTDFMSPMHNTYEIVNLFLVLTFLILLRV